MAKSNFSRALGRELGKNTGKLISNKLFGDGHSTPHRITAKVQAAEIRANSAKAKAKAIEEKANAELEIEEMKINLEKDREESVFLQEIAKASFGNNKDEASQSVGELLSLAESHNSKVIRQAALSKVESGLLKLIQFGATVEVEYYEKKIKKLKHKNRIPLYIGIAVLVFFIFIYSVIFSFLF
jgi:hypothetical protein